MIGEHEDGFGDENLGGFSESRLSLIENSRVAFVANEEGSRKAMLCAMLCYATLSFATHSAFKPSQASSATA